MTRNPSDSSAYLGDGLSGVDLSGVYVVIDAVEDGVSGILVDPGDPHAVAAATIRLLTDTELAMRIGRDARRRSGDFAWPSVAARVDGVLRAAIMDGPRVHDSKGNRLAFAREFLLGPRS